MSAIASSLQLLYGRSPVERLAELRSGLREAADQLGAIERAHRAIDAEALATQLSGLQRSAASLAHSLRQMETPPDAAA